MSLESQIEAVLSRDGRASSSESTVVALHCQQMREWGVRGGHVEWRPIQDPYGERLKTITRIGAQNQIPQRLGHVVDSFTCRGEILWYFVPDPKIEGKYKIEYYVGGLNHPDPQFKVFYKLGGLDIDRVLITYSYDQDTPGSILSRQKRWVQILITDDYIEQSESVSKPDFNSASYGAYLNWDGSIANTTYAGYGQPTGRQRYPNPFKPYLPIVLCPNNARQLGQKGSDDFNCIRSLIEGHERLVTKAHKNLRVFANPILVTTRSSAEVMTRMGSNAPQTWAGQNRYVDNSGSYTSGSTNPADSPSWGMQRTPSGFMPHSFDADGESLDIVFDRVGEGERFGFIQADAVSGDQNLWIRQVRELIHWILGGIDPLGISSSATFGEIKTLFGRLQNSAEQKAEALFGFRDTAVELEGTGLTKVFEIIILHEEEKFKDWFLEVLNQFAPGQFRGLTKEQMDDDLCQQLWSATQPDGDKPPLLPIPRQLIKNKIGLVPAGDRSVTWRYTRQVFQNTTREDLDASIRARNEREDGLSQEWVLRKQYPEMTDQEIRNAMSGFSPRVIGNAITGIQGLMQLYQLFMAMPDPSDPKSKAPWGVRLGIPDLLEQALLTLRKEIAYGQPTYEDAEEPAPIDLQSILNQLSLAPPNLQPPTPNLLTPNDQLLQPNGNGSSLPAYNLPADVGSAFARYGLGAGNQRSQLPGRNFVPNGTAGYPYSDPATGTPIGGNQRGAISTGSPATAESTATQSVPGSGELSPELWNLYRPQLAALYRAWLLSQQQS